MEDKDIGKNYTIEELQQILEDAAIKSHIENPIVWNPNFSLTEIDELKIDLDFSRFDNLLLKTELEETKLKLASIPTPVVNDQMYHNLKNLMEQVLEQNNSILPDVKFIKNIYTKPSPSKKSEQKQQTAMEEKMLLRNKILRRGKTGD